MNISFRRRLKHILKNAQRLSREQRDQYINSQLLPLGLWANNFVEFSVALTDMHRARGRTFRRIGNAAKKREMVVDIFSVATFIQQNRDVRDILFFRPVFLKTPQEIIMWKVWPAKPIERKIGV